MPVWEYLDRVVCNQFTDHHRGVRITGYVHKFLGTRRSRPQPCEELKNPPFRWTRFTSDLPGQNPTGTTVGIRFRCPEQIPTASSQRLDVFDIPPCFA